MRVVFVLSAILVLATTAMAQMEDAYPYSPDWGGEDFDSMGPTGTKAPGATPFTTYWGVSANYVDRALSLTPAEDPAVDPYTGWQATGYNAGLNGDSDRNLGILKTNRGESCHFTIHFVNATSETLKELELRYDIECHFVRWAYGEDPNHDRYDAFLNAFLSEDPYLDWPYYHRPPERPDFDLGSAFHGSVDNSLVSESDSRRWLDDDEAEDLGLVVRDLGGVVALPESRWIEPGESFYIHFQGLWGSSDATARINVGIDNVRVPEPAGISLLTAGAVASVLRRKRR